MDQPSFYNCSLMNLNRRIGHVSQDTGLRLHLQRLSHKYRPNNHTVHNEMSHLNPPLNPRLIT